MNAIGNAFEIALKRPLPELEQRIVESKQDMEQDRKNDWVELSQALKKAFGIPLSKLTDKQLEVFGYHCEIGYFFHSCETEHLERKLIVVPLQAYFPYSVLVFPKANVKGLDFMADCLGIDATFLLREVWKKGKRISLNALRDNLRGR